MTNIDPWHYTGSPRFHKSDLGTQFLSLVKNKLPELETQFEVGSTGYPKNINFNSDWGWTTDFTGRMFVCTPKYWIFQRMTEGHVLMYSNRNKILDWNDAGKLLEELISDLSRF